MSDLKATNCTGTPIWRPNPLTTNTPVRRERGSAGTGTASSLVLPSGGGIRIQRLGRKSAILLAHDKLARRGLDTHPEQQQK
jgi:hypothetical protein